MELMSHQPSLHGTPPLKFEWPYEGAWSDALDGQLLKETIHHLCSHGCQRLTSLEMVFSSGSEDEHHVPLGVRC